MDAAPVYFWISDGCAWVRVAGSGTRFNSTAVKDFAKDAVKRGMETFVVDLRECPEVDSTFMGTLTFIALRLRELKRGKVQITHANIDIVKGFENLGLDQLLDINPREP